MDFKTLHEDWKTLSPGPFTEPEDEAIYKEFMKIKELLVYQKKYIKFILT